MTNKYYCPKCEGNFVVLDNFLINPLQEFTRGCSDYDYSCSKCLTSFSVKKEWQKDNFSITPSFKYITKVLINNDIKKPYIVTVPELLDDIFENAYRNYQLQLFA
jgi:hypothetical protein